MTPAVRAAAQAAIDALRAQAGRRRAAADVTDRYVPLSQDTRDDLARGLGVVRSKLAALAFEVLGAHRSRSPLPVSVHHLAGLLGYEDTAHLDVAALHLEEWLTPSDVCYVRRLAASVERKPALHVDCTSCRATVGTPCQGASS